MLLPGLGRDTLKDLAIIALLSNTKVELDFKSNFTFLEFSFSFDDFDLFEGFWDLFSLGAGVDAFSILAGLA
jgi:hypothetical protein